MVVLRGGEEEEVLGQCEWRSRVACGLWVPFRYDEGVGVEGRSGGGWWLLNRSRCPKEERSDWRTLGVLKSNFGTKRMEAKEWK